MALTKYKANKEYRDPNTGTIYLDGVGGSSQAGPSSTVQDVAAQAVKKQAAQASQSPSKNVLYGTNSGQQSKTVTKKTTSGSNGYTYDDFATSPDTDRYKRKLTSLEANRPDDFSSRYERAIQGVLSGILNRKPFDINNDVNYDMLYNNYKQRYETEADKAMRDSMASANAATGGYGSSYGQAVGQQQYDSTMQGLNDQNLTLMQLAYQMYGDERDDNYKKIGTLTDLDAIDYGRYRDDMSDYFTDRDYYAGQYDNSYGRDFNKWSVDRDFDYGTYINDRNYDNTVTEQEYAKYQDAVAQAAQLASAGLSVPDYLTAVIDQYSQKYGYGSGNSSAALQQLAAQAQAIANAKASKSSSSKNDVDEGTSEYSSQVINNNISWDIAKDKGTDKQTAIEAIDEAYWNYYSGKLKSHGAKGKAEALNQAMQNYKNITGITDGKTIKAHFDKVVKAKQKEEL